MVVTHDPAVGVAMDRTVSMRDGRVGAEGRRGEQFAVIGKDGSVQLPSDVLVSPGEFSVDFYTLRGDIQLELGRINEAAGSYFAVITAGPGNLHAQYSLGVCLRLLEWWQPALRPRPWITNWRASGIPTSGTTRAVKSPAVTGSSCSPMAS